MFIGNAYKWFGSLKGAFKPPPHTQIYLKALIMISVATEWIKNVTVTIYNNNGNKLQCHSYTEISLLCTGYEILTTCLNNRLKQYADHKTGE